MEWSSYNFIFDLDEKETLIYNTLTYYLIALEREDIKNIFHEDYREHREQLKEFGIMVESKTDEREKMISAIRDREDDNRSLNVWMFTTMDCNFGCSYCFEKDENSSNKKMMTQETADKFIERMIHLDKENEFEKICITLTGGEPMLNRDIMRYVHGRLCENIGAKRLNYTLITNGSIMDEDALAIIKDCGISTIQITLDGPKEIHDERRHYKNNTGTFDEIFKNIKRLVKLKSEHNFIILIRVNIDIGNYEYVLKLMEYFKEVNIHDQVVFNLGDTIIKYEDRKTEEFILKKTIEIYDAAVEKGYNAIISEAQPCSMKNEFYLMLSPEGDIYKCPAIVGNKEFVIDNINHINSAKENYVEKNEPWKGCIDCEIVGTCFGGCGYREYLKDGKFTDKKNCRKEYLKEVLKRNLTKDYYVNNKGVS